MILILIFISIYAHIYKTLIHDKNYSLILSIYYDLIQAAIAVK